MYPERGGVYVNIPRASRQRALIINKLGTRHGVPRGGEEGGGGARGRWEGGARGGDTGQSQGGGRTERPIEREREERRRRRRKTERSRRRRFSSDTRRSEGGRGGDKRKEERSDGVRGLRRGGGRWRRRLNPQKHTR